MINDGYTYLDGDANISTSPKPKGFYKDYQYKIISNDLQSVLISVIDYLEYQLKQGLLPERREITENLKRSVLKEYYKIEISERIK